MQQVHFFSLSRAIQERFIEAARAQGAPLPLLVARPPAPLGSLVWAGASLGLAAAWLVFLGIGYGQLGHALAIAPAWTIAVHAALLSAAIWCAFRAHKVWLKQRSLPFLPTVYLFPIGVIDARAPAFVVHSMAELSEVTAHSSGLSLRFQGGAKFDFSVAPERRSDAVALVEAHRDRLRTLPEEAREKELVLLDPLRDNGFRNPFAPVESIPPPSRRGWYREPALAVVLGLVLGVAAYSVRNVFSEARLYTDARAADSTAAYRDYLAHGGKRAEVGDILLPRAELRDVRKEGSVEAIERYIAAHPGSKIAAEVQVALRASLLAALEQAKKAGTLAALNEFAARYGKHDLVGAEIERARRDHLARVLANFKKKSNGDPDVVALATRLVERGAAKGPRVVVHFRRRLPSTLEDSEKQLIKSSYYAGEVTLPSKYFDAVSSQKREERFGREIVERLQEAFPPEIARFELGSTAEDTSEDLPQVDVPTLLVTYRHELSGAYMSRKPRAAFAGVGIFVKANFLMPAQAPTLSFKYTGWHAPDVKRIEAGELELSAVYDDMTEKAFRKFLKKYWATWFSEPAASTSAQ